MEVSDKTKKKSETEKSDPQSTPQNQDVLTRFRNNPWMLASIVLGILLLGSLIFTTNGVRVASESEITERVSSFLNAQVDDGEVTIDSVTKKDSFYTLTVNYKGDQVTLYSSLDGNYLFSDAIPTGATGIVTPPARESSVSQGQAPRVDVRTSDAPSLGSVEAPVVMLEFSDYQCPFCKKFYDETLPLITQNYIETGKVMLVYRDFPLAIHPEAGKAAEAARCYSEQTDDYFAYHDVLFENQARLSDTNYKQWARELDVPDASAFDICLASSTYADAVTADFLYGQELGVTGTPTFYINGIPVTGAQPYSVFEQLIEAELL